MEAVCGGAKPYLSTAHLESEHFRIKDKSMELFTKKPKMGGEEFSRQYKEKLDQVRKLSLLRISYFVLWYLQNKGVYNFVSAWTGTKIQQRFIESLLKLLFILIKLNVLLIVLTYINNNVLYFDLFVY